jgi:hypothetical protein
VGRARYCRGRRREKVRSLDGFAGGREGVEVGGSIRLVAERGTEVARASYRPARLRDQPNASGGSRGGGAPVGEQRPSGGAEGQVRAPTSSSRAACRGRQGGWVQAEGRRPAGQWHRPVAVALQSARIGGPPCGWGRRRKEIRRAGEKKKKLTNGLCLSVAHPTFDDSEPNIKLVDSIPSQPNKK